MTRALIAAALAAATLPAAADAKAARFVAYVEGKQVTTWEQPRHQVGVRDCTGAQFVTESGSETVKFRTKPARVLAYKPNPQAGVALLYGTWNRFASGARSLKGTGKVTRAYTEVVDYEPGPCGSRTPEPAPYRDCRTEAWNPSVSVRWEGSKVFVDANDFEVKFLECPLQSASGVMEEDFTEGVWQRYPPRDLFDRSQGLVEVLGSKTFTEELRFGSTTTEITWKLRLRRARQR